MPGDWKDLIADITKFYGWGPHDAWGLTWTQIQEWARQMIRMSKLMVKSNG